MQNKNFLKISLYECKLEENEKLSSFGNFKLSISFNDKIFTTDKIIKSQTKFKGGKIFYFELPQDINESHDIMISAIGTSWMFFNSTICSLNINFQKNLSMFNDQKHWYFLKNDENKNTIKILISIWTEYSLLDGVISHSQTSQAGDASVFNEQSTYINHSSLFNTVLTDKIDSKQKLNSTATMVRSQRDNGTKGLLMNFYNDTNQLIYNQEIPNKLLPNNFIILSENRNNNTFNPVMEDMANNHISNDIVNNGRNTAFDINNIYSNNLDNTNIIEFEDIMELIDKCEKEGVDPNMIKNLRSKVEELREKEEVLDNDQKKFTESLDKLKEKNKKLNKEKQALDAKIIKYKEEQAEYEQKNITLNQCLHNFENNFNDYNIKELVDNNAKDIFYNINYYLSTGNDIKIDNKKPYDNFRRENQFRLSGSDELVDSLSTEKINKLLTEVG